MVSVRELSQDIDSAGLRNKSNEHVDGKLHDAKSGNLPFYEKPVANRYLGGEEGTRRTAANADRLVHENFNGDSKAGLAFLKQTENSKIGKMDFNELVESGAARKLVALQRENPQEFNRIMNDDNATANVASLNKALDNANKPAPAIVAKAEPKVAMQKPAVEAHKPATQKTETPPAARTEAPATPTTVASSENAPPAPPKAEAPMPEAPPANPTIASSENTPSAPGQDGTREGPNPNIGVISEDPSQGPEKIKQSIQEIINATKETLEGILKGGSLMTIASAGVNLLEKVANAAGIELPDMKTFDKDTGLIMMARNDTQAPTAPTVSSAPKMDMG
jgi:hypothetical protein